MKNLHPSKRQSVITILAIFAAYMLLHFQAAKMYSLQIFMLSITLFFIIQRIKGAKLWHVMPSKHSLELALLTFSFVFLIGSSGNTHSTFFSLTYIHLFFLVFSTSIETTITAIFSLFLIHYGLEPIVGLEEIGTLLSIPAIGALFIFAKNQYDSIEHKDKQLTEAVVEKEQLLDQSTKNEESLQQFISNFLRPKLDIIKRLLVDPTEDNIQVEKQLSLLETELDKVVQRLSKKQLTQTQDSAEES